MYCTVILIQKTHTHTLSKLLPDVNAENATKHTQTWNHNGTRQLIHISTEWECRSLHKSKGVSEYDFIWKPILFCNVPKHIPIFTLRCPSAAWEIVHFEPLQSNICANLLENLRRYSISNQKLALRALRRFMNNILLNDYEQILICTGCSVTWKSQVVCSITVFLNICTELPLNQILERAARVKIVLCRSELPMCDVCAANKVLFPFFVLNLSTLNFVLMHCEVWRPWWKAKKSQGFYIVIASMHHHDGMYSCGTSHIYNNLHGVKVSLTVGRKGSLDVC